MLREDAILLSKMLKVEQEESRGIYPEDLVSRQILSKHNCKAKVDSFVEDNLLTFESTHGANVYHVTKHGIYQICAYRDLALEIKEA